MTRETGRYKGEGPQWKKSDDPLRWHQIRQKMAQCADREKPIRRIATLSNNYPSLDTEYIRLIKTNAQSLFWGACKIIREKARDCLFEDPRSQKLSEIRNNRLPYHRQGWKSHRFVDSDEGAAQEWRHRKVEMGSRIPIFRHKLTMILSIKDESLA